MALVSVWVAWTLFMWFAATRSFRTAGRMLSHPQPQLAQVLKPLGQDASRVVLRYFASQVNAAYFRAYGLAQIFLGVVVAILVGWCTPRDHTGFVLVCVMLAIAVILALIVAPQIASLGSALVINPSPAAMPRFWMLHGAYTGLDGIKLLLGITLVVRWLLMI
ncbi:MAG: hypothetical protein ACRD10_03535 [Terriglobia bacterium]